MLPIPRPRILAGALGAVILGAAGTLVPQSLASATSIHVGITINEEKAYGWTVTRDTPVRPEEDVAWQIDSAGNVSIFRPGRYTISHTENPTFSTPCSLTVRPYNGGSIDGDVDIVFDGVQCHTSPPVDDDYLPSTPDSMSFNVNGTTTLIMKGINSITTSQPGTAALTQRGSGPVRITSEDPSAPGYLNLHASRGISTAGSLTVDSVGVAVSAAGGPAVASNQLTLQNASASLTGNGPLPANTHITGGSVRLSPEMSPTNPQGESLTHYRVDPTVATDLLEVDGVPWPRRVTPRDFSLKETTFVSENPLVTTINPGWDVWLTVGHHVISTPDHSQCWLANEGSIEEKNCVDVVEGLAPVISQAAVGPTWVTVTADPSTDGRLAEFSLDGTHWATTDEATHQATLEGLIPGSTATIRTRFAPADSGTVPEGEVSFELPARVTVGDIVKDTGSGLQVAAVGTKLAELANADTGWSFVGQADATVDVEGSEPAQYRFARRFDGAVVPGVAVSYTAEDVGSAHEGDQCVVEGEQLLCDITVTPRPLENSWTTEPVLPESGQYTGKPFAARPGTAVYGSDTQRITYVGTGETEYPETEMPPRNAGTYCVKVEVPAFAGDGEKNLPAYGGLVEQNCELTISKASSADLIKPIPGGRAGDHMFQLVEPFDWNLGIEFAFGDEGTVPAEGWSTVAPVGFSAGDFTFWWRFAGNENYEPTEPQFLHVHIDKGLYAAGSTEPVLTFYTGQPAPEPKVLLNYAPVRIEYSPADREEWTTQRPVDAGKYRTRSVVENSPNWEDDISSPSGFTILRAQSEVSLTDVPQDKTFDGKPVAAPTVTSNGFGIPRVEYSLADKEEWSVEAPRAAGKYKVRGVIDENRNWGGSESEISYFEIWKAPADLTIEGAPGDQEFRTEPMILPLVKANHEEAKPTSEWFVLKDGVWSACEYPQNVGHYKLVATVAATRNYEAAEKSIEFTISQARNGVNGVEIPDWNFGEEPPIFAPPLAAFGEPIVEYAPVGSDSWSQSRPTQPGEYQARVRVEGSANWSAAESKTVTFTISKKPAAPVQNPVVPDWTQGEEFELPTPPAGGHYEFAPLSDNPEWSTEKPSEPGNYLVKLVKPETETETGSESEAVPFTIEKKEETSTETPPETEEPQVTEETQEPSEPDPAEEPQESGTTSWYTSDWFIGLLTVAYLLVQLAPVLTPILALLGLV